MNIHAVLAPIIGFILFTAFWCLIHKLVSLAAWGRLAKHYAHPEPVATSERFRLAQAMVGFVSYRQIIQAGVAPEGLSLSVFVLFRVGHPALLIPWSALEPVQSHKLLWTTYFTTKVRVGTGQMKFQFTDHRLMHAMQAEQRQEQAPAIR